MRTSARDENMNKWTLTLCVVAAVLVVFVMTPTKHQAFEDPFAKYTYVDPQGVAHPPKSGLRLAIEGRLAWLGLVSE